MAQDSISELGRVLGGISNEKDAIKSNLEGDESEAQLSLAISELFKTTGRVVGLKKQYKTSSFIIGHIIQGELDNPTYQLDGGYVEPLPIGLTMPLVMPLTFTGGEDILFDITF